MSKRGIIGLSVCIAAFVALMAAATFFDLRISVAVGNANSVYGQFFNYLGETPTWLGIPIACLILFRAAKKHKYRKVLQPIFLCCTFVGFFFAARYFTEEMTADIKWRYLYVTLFGLAMTGIAIFSVKNVKDEIFDKLVIFAVFILALIAVSQGITAILKVIWARQRFRNLQIGNMFLGTSEGYSPWYKPMIGKHNPDALYPDELGGKGTSGAYRSFPSGHTVAAAASFAIIILPDLFERLKRYQPIFYAVPAVYTVLVAFSRIVNRAHYLSDVTVAGFYTVGLAFLFVYLLKKIWIKYKLPYSELFAAEEETKE